MRCTYYYSSCNYYFGAFEPLTLLQDRLKLSTLMQKTNDPDYPINSRTDICLLEEESGTILDVSIYPERGWIPDYLQCKKVKAELLVKIRNKDPHKADGIKRTIEDILRNFMKDHH